MIVFFSMLHRHGYDPYSLVVTELEGSDGKLCICDEKNAVFV